MTTGERIKSLRELNKITQTELAERIGTTKQNIYKYENNIITNIPADKIEQIAICLKVSPAFLMGWDTSEKTDIEALMDKYSNIKPLRLKKFPMLGKTSGGKPVLKNLNSENFFSTDMDIKADFCLAAEDDSMINARINTGDIVFIKDMPTVENGEIAAVIINDTISLKRVYYYPEKRKLMLVSENPKYEPLVYLEEEINQIQILGKAIYFLSVL